MKCSGLNWSLRCSLPSLQKPNNVHTGRLYVTTLNITYRPNLSHRRRRIWRHTNPPIKWVPAFFSWRKWQGSGFDHSPLPSASSADVKNEWICISTTLIRLHGVGMHKFTFNHLFLCLPRCLFPLLTARVSLTSPHSTFYRLTYGENC